MDRGLRPWGTLWTFPLLISVLLSCGDSTAPSSRVPVTITASVTSLSLSSLGETRQLTAIARDEGGNAHSIQLSWSSLNPAVATVSGTGLVTANGNGSTTILVTAGAISGSVMVTVQQLPALITIVPGTVALSSIGESAQLATTVQDALGKPVSSSAGVPTVSWSSSNPAVATVSTSGRVTAAGNGSTLVSATVGSLSANIPATVNQRAATISLSAQALSYSSLSSGQSVIATVRDEQGATIPNAPVTWSVANTAVATVSTDGVVTAVGNGQTTVTAKVSGVTATVPVTVLQVTASVVIAGGSPKLLGTSSAFRLTAYAIDANAQPVSAAPIIWSSSDASVAGVDPSGMVRAVRAGNAEIRAKSGSIVGVFQLEVVAFRRVAVDPYLATPIQNALWTIPVAAVSYIPTADGVNLDVSKSPDFYTLGPMTIAQVEANLVDIYRRKKMALEEGSRFRAYKDASARPSIGIRVVEHLVVYDQIPASSKTIGSGPLVQYIPDYKRAFRDNGLEMLIPAQGVRQVWLAQSSFSANFPSYNPAIHNLADTRWVAESNMASPTTGDISNSYREADDLPIFGHTYVVYGINFRRSQAEAVHNVGHQLESIFAYVNQKYELNTKLFWNKFVGLDVTSKFVQGRAGATHFPPNAVNDYDYSNPTAVLSDIEDWRPDGTGSKKLVNAGTWGNRAFPWPGAQDFGQRVETQWYVHWFQSMPGLNNGIALGSGTMTNWWRFFADWDASIREGIGLATVRDGTPIFIRNDFSGGILLNPGGGLSAGQSVVLYGDAPIEVSVYDCGEPGTTSCIFDKYMLQPGKSYRVIQNPSGPANNLTIVER